MNNNGRDVGGLQPGHDLGAPTVEVVALDDRLSEAVGGSPNPSPVGVAHNDHGRVAGGEIVPRSE